MKLLTCLITMLFISCLANAQIFATTTAGKKVILNTDGTWKYANPNESAHPCAVNHTGNVALKNATGSDIFFYYSEGSEYANAQLVKIKSGSTKRLDDLFVGFYSVGGTQTGVKKYLWKATLEPASNGVSLAYVSGAIEKGTFLVDECSLKEVSIGE